MTKQGRWILVMLLTLALASLACSTLLGGDEEDSATTEDAVATNVGEEVPDESAGEDAIEGQATPEIATEPPPEATDQPAAEADEAADEAPETLSLNEANNFGEPVGVDTYRISLEFGLEQAGGDGATIGSISAEGARTVDPPAMTLTFTAEGISDFGPGQSFTFTQIGDADYFALPDAGCISGMADMGELPLSIFLDSGGILGGLQGATLEERDVEVNGVVADHYTFTESALDIAGPTAGSISEVEGDIFVAKEGYVVRATMTGIGTGGLLTGDPTAESNVYYELNYLDFNQPIEIVPPAGCEGVGESDFPMLGDAADVSSFSGLVTYKTGQPFETIVEFYRNEMSAAGWTIEQEFVGEPTASFTFAKEGRQVQINIVEDAVGDGFIVAIVDMEG